MGKAKKNCVCKKDKGKMVVADYFRAVAVCESINELEDALKKVEAQVEATRAKHQQLLYFKAETEKRLRVLKREPSQ